MPICEQVLKSHAVAMIVALTLVAQAPPRFVPITPPANIEWSGVKNDLVNRIKHALCPEMVPDFMAIEYFDDELSVHLLGDLKNIGFQIVLSEKAEFFLSEPNPDPHRFPKGMEVKEYIEIILVPLSFEVPEDICQRLPWADFTSVYHLHIVDMGTGHGFRWYGRLHLWEQDDLRERLKLVGGQDRKALMEFAQKVNDRGGMTRNSVNGRMDRLKTRIN